jgi:CBS domain containing-hemolysin-like protein
MSLVAVLATIGLVAASAFFVAVEFAVLTARGYRLEAEASKSRSARAALASSRDLSVLLAASQLGITLCVLGLGAVSKPAVDYAVAPFLESLGLSVGAADVLAFAVALLVVTFLHLVVGEMAPKSWAIAHPERVAVLLALPARAFVVATRPLLLLLNGMANWCLRRFGVEPVDEVASARSPQDLRELVDHSAAAGTLGPEQRDQLLVALDLDAAPLRALVQRRGPVAAVPETADAAAVQQEARASGHLRLLVRDVGGAPLGVVHVRDTLTLAPNAPVRDLVRPVMTLADDVPVHEALREMRRASTQFALVQAPGQPPAVVTMHDLLEQLLPAR